MKRLFVKKFYYIVIACFIAWITLTTLITLRLEFQKQNSIDKVSITPSFLTITPPKSSFMVKGSIPYWDQENSFSDFKNHIDDFDYVNLFWYYLGKKGEVVAYTYTNENPDIIEYARKYKVRVSAVITNLPDFPGADWDSKRVENVIASEKLQEIHINNIVHKLKEYNFDGIIIDYESLQLRAKTNFSNFIRALSIALHKNGKIVTVVLHPKTGDHVTGEEIGGFQDWYTLASYADQLQIMGYDENSNTDRAGPIASSPWVRKIILYAKSLNIKRDKLFMGIPMYGYDWDTSDRISTTDVKFNDVVSLLENYRISPEWNVRFESPYLLYKKNGHSHEVWFENVRSVESKMRLVRDAGFAGVTFWRLGEEDQEIWKMVGKYKN